MKKVLITLILMSALLLNTKSRDLSYASTILQTAGGKAYAVGFYNGLTTFFTIDLNTGQMTVLNTFPTIQAVDAFVATVDLEADRYFQPAYDNDFARRLLIINTTSGALVDSPPFSATLSILEYKGGRLYGVMYDHERASNVFVEIDPSTLNPNVLMAIPGVNSILAGVSAIDDDYFVFEGSSSRGYELFKIDLQTLEITTIPLSHTLAHFVLADSALIGITGAVPLNYLVRINLLTGESEIISEVKVQALFQGASIFDRTKGWYIFPVIDLENKQRLFIFDIQTGELVAAPELTVVPGGATFASKVNALAFTGQLKSFEKGWGNYNLYLPFTVKQ